MDENSDLEAVPSQQSFVEGPETSSRVSEGISVGFSSANHLSQCCALDRSFAVSFGALTFEEKQQIIMKVRTSTVDRSFSCLKRIKSTVRNIQCENRLFALPLLSAEKGLLDELQKKLNVSPEVIRNAVDGLVHLLVESCRNKLDEQDFQDSVLALGFSEQQQQTLSTFYHSKKEEIQSALLRPTLDIPHYQDLDWRVDIQLASRALHNQVTPLVSMKLSLDNGQCVPLQTDPNNLLHMTQVLEQALQEAKGQHTRRIQRTFK
uniref:COMM domain-containing protein n=1 Tax=Timema cristinae TaxID=61476 RepID=A0A7R9CHM3_TIMCR|nr:unnamed protein product [Timema cristinae]